MTHKDLVKLCKEYLLTAKQCNPVFTELSASKLDEFPDVLGFTANDSFQIECKVSKSDFIADLKKGHHNEIGIGTQRYYCFPKELYLEICNQILTGYGHLVCSDNGRVEQVRFKHSNQWVTDHKKEVSYLRSRILSIQRFGR